MLKHIIEDQTYRGSVIHAGKKISAFIGNELVGVTGYIGCKNPFDSSKSALLRVLTSPFDIFVENDMRKKGVGYFLMEQLISLLQKEDYSRLFVQGVINTARGFYVRTFNKLKQSQEIISYESNLTSTSFAPNYNILLK